MLKRIVTLFQIIERYARLYALALFETALFPVLLLLSALSRLSRREIDIGFGPEPIINHIYLKRALERLGYTAQTFVQGVFFITEDFDVRADQRLKGRLSFFIPYFLFCIIIFRYKGIYIYFNGGPLGFTQFLWRQEPLLYRIAGVRVVVMPYGGDVQDMSRSPNLLFKNAMSRDYPFHRLRRNLIASRIDLWTQRADHIISGCEWVDYMYHWDTLMLAQFSIDTDDWKPAGKEETQLNRDNSSSTFRILHAPNHRNIKGTQFFIDAVNELSEEGLDVELVIVERVPNTEIKRLLSSVDVVADQLIIGWYAMFALEAMAMEKPVLCHIRRDLEELYISAGLIEDGEIPIIKCSPTTIKEVIKDLVLQRDRLPEIGRRSRDYVLKHHSLAYVGEVLNSINLSVRIRPCKELRLESVGEEA